jgi:hypothetical protein
MGGGFRGIGGFYMCSLGGSFGISFRDGSFKVRPRHRRKLIVEVEHYQYLRLGLSYFTFVCWIAPQNPVVNQIFGGLTGKILHCICRVPSILEKLILIYRSWDNSNYV